MEPKQSKVNTMIMLIMGGCAAVAWGLAQHTLSLVESNQVAMRAEMMPRHEVELQLADIRLRMTEFKTDEQRLQLKIADLEADVIRIKIEFQDHKRP